MYRGTYSVGHEPLTDEAWMQASVLLLDDGVSTHRSAAHLHGFRKKRKSDPIEVATTKRMHNRPAKAKTKTRCAQPELRFHRVSPAEARRFTHRHAIKVTTAERTCLDCAATLPYKQARRIVNQALVMRKLTIHTLLKEMERSPGHPGLKAMRKVIATARPTRSEAEDLAAAMLVEGGIGPFETNVRLTGEVDIHLPEHDFVIEVDGAAFHDNPIARADDHAKTQRLINRNKRVARLRWPDITINRGQTLASLRSSFDEGFLESRKRG
jgi:very-short-patch-repair endonuclease